MPQQLRRQPARPITLGQAEVGIELAITPVRRTHSAAHAHGHGLTVRQGQACIQTLANAAGLQANVDVSESHRIALERLEGDLTVEHSDLRHRLHLLQQLLWIERLVVGFRQTVEGPGALFIFMQAQVQATHFQVGQAQLTLAEAGPQIRHHLDSVQA
ncbi:hypothetical protein D3C79_640160 [compost metagenome]